MESWVRRRSALHPRVAPLMLATLLFACMPLTGTSVASAQADDTPPASCHVTLPNGDLPPASLVARSRDSDFYGNGTLWVLLWWNNGVIRAGLDAGVPMDDGVSIKTPWVRGPELRGPLTIIGRRLDAGAPALHGNVGSDDRNPGFVASGVVFPTPGCWEVTGRVGAVSLTYVAWVTFTPEIGRQISFTRHCPVTIGTDGDPGLPQYVIPGTRAGSNGTPPTQAYPSPDEFFGENGLWVVLWPDGVISVDEDSPYVTPHGPEGGVSMKFPMYRDDSAKGTITISGERLDATAPPLTANVPDGYGDVGFQATGIDFPTPGCWEVAVHSGSATLTFVTLVTIVPAATPEGEATPDTSPDARFLLVPESPRLRARWELTTAFEPVHSAEVLAEQLEALDLAIAAVIQPTAS